jgi:hypothetical protein
MHHPSPSGTRSRASVRASTGLARTRIRFAAATAREGSELRHRLDARRARHGR